MSAKSFYYECKKSEESDDRSSVSSIPWNSDAIKQNQKTWEYIERMMHQEEEEMPPDEENELRQEILDWQQKFPQLAKTKAKLDWLVKQDTFNRSSTNVSETNELSSSPDNESIEDDDQAFHTEFLSSPKTKNQTNTRRNMTTNRTEDARLELADVFGKDLHITPLALRQRKSARLLEQRNSSTASSVIDSPVPAKATRYKNLSKSVLHAQIATGGNAPATNSRFHMPPILNVLESKRRFCGLNGNRSFVQLTQIQAKSAAVHSAARQPPMERQFKQVWNKPLAAVSVNSRFFNNRNAIILPALQQQQMLSTTNSSNQSAGGVGSSRQFNSFPTSNSSLSSADIRGRQRMHCLSNSQTTTSTSGRSISAVPIHMHGSFYHL